jgi:hypothetical protein
MRCDISSRYFSSRRQPVTTFERALGFKTAQKAMAHDIGSFTYWSHYERGLGHVDFTDLVVDGGNRRAAGGTTKLSSHFLYATDKAALERDVSEQAENIVVSFQANRSAVSTERGLRSFATKLAQRSVGNGRALKASCCEIGEHSPGPYAAAVVSDTATAAPSILSPAASSRFPPGHGRFRLAL